MARITFGGLASGLDTNDLIDKMLQIERQPIFQFQDRIKLLQRQRDVWKDVNMRLRHLRETIRPPHVASMSRFYTATRSTFVAKQALSTDYAVVASATAQAQNGVYDFTVSKLASHHTVAMETDINSLRMSMGLGMASPSTYLNMTGSFSINGKEINIRGSDSLIDIRDKINAAGADVQASIVAGHLMIKSNKSGAEGAMHFSYMSGDDVLAKLKIFSDTRNFIPGKDALEHVIGMKSDIQGVLGEGTSINTILGMEGSFSIEIDGYSLVINADRSDSLARLTEKINIAYQAVGGATDIAEIVPGSGVVGGVMNPPHVNYGRLVITSQDAGSHSKIEMGYLSGDDILDGLGIYRSFHTVEMRTNIQGILGSNTNANVSLNREGTFFLEVNGIRSTIRVNMGDSLQTVANKINAAGDVTARIEDGRLIVKSEMPGPAGIIKMGHVSGSGSDILGFLGINSSASEGDIDVFYNEIRTGSDALTSSIWASANLGVSTNEPMGLKGSFSIKVGTDISIVTHKVEVEPSDTLDDLVDKINSFFESIPPDPSDPIIASIENGKLKLTSHIEGMEGQIILSHVAENPPGDNILEKMGLNFVIGDFFNETAAAQDAVFTFNGLSLTRSTNEISDLVEGVTFYLQDVSEKKVSIEVSTNTQTAIEAIQAFVEQYNSVNAFIREKLQKPEDNQPAESTVGLLQGNTTLMRIDRMLRSMIHSPLPGIRVKTPNGYEISSSLKYNSFSALGVTTMDKEGYLRLDTAKLAKVLEEDAEAVADLMCYEVLDKNGLFTDEYDGLFVALDNYLRRLLVTEEDSMGRTLYAISVQQETGIQRRIDELHKRIEVKEMRIARYEERLIRQFTTLETHISNMQSQSDYFERLLAQIMANTAASSGNRRR